MSARGRAVTATVVVLLCALVVALGAGMVLRGQDGPARKAAGEAGRWSAAAAHDGSAPSGSGAPAPDGQSHQRADGPFAFERLDDPDRTVVKGSDGAVLATFTDGARTVVLQGPERTFEEPDLTEASVTTTAWVRLAPHEWSAGEEDAEWLEPWLRAQLTDTTPDVLAVATQYFTGAPDVLDDNGQRIGGDADFGPPSPDSDARLEANDFYDYLGVGWSFSDGIVESADPDRAGALDCSGYVRMVYGHRLGYPLLGSNDRGPGLPRRAYAMAENGPGSLLIKDRGDRPETSALDQLQAGDLVFFVTDDEPGIDHTGIYVGVDNHGQHRFFSSRGSVNGPTMGDVQGASVLDGDAFFARNFRAARRI